MIAIPSRVFSQIPSSLLQHASTGVKLLAGSSLRIQAIDRLGDTSKVLGVIQHRLADTTAQFQWNMILLPGNSCTNCCVATLCS